MACRVVAWQPIQLPAASLLANWWLLVMLPHGGHHSLHSCNSFPAAKASHQINLFFILNSWMTTIAARSAMRQHNRHWRRHWQMAGKQWPSKQSLPEATECNAKKKFTINSTTFCICLPFIVSISLPAAGCLHSFQQFHLSAICLRPATSACTCSYGRY